MAFCCRNLSQSSASASPRKSLVPYSAESSDSETEPVTANHNTSKNGHSTPLSPLKNGFARESTSCAKSSSSVAPCGKAKTSVSAGVGEVVNGWKVTRVDKCRNGVVTSPPPPSWDVVDTHVNDTK